jgi:competence protein ComEC
MAEPGVQYHDAIASNAVRAVTFSGSGCNGTVNVRQDKMMDAAPVALGVGARMHFLYRDPRNHADPNGNSVVVRLDLGSRRVLLAGDAEGGERELPSEPPQPNSIEARLIACCAADLKSDVLVVGHHGSLTSSRRAFLDAVGASIYAISSGPYPYRRVRLPDPEIVTELEGRGEVYRTDRDDLYRIEDENRSCELNPRKIGSDADETPGGCNNVLIEIGPSGTMRAGYNAVAD